MEYMYFDDYRFVLKTCASSENEVTGEDIDLEDSFECDLKGVKLKTGIRLFSPRIVRQSYGGKEIEHSVFPDFNFTVIEVRKDGIVLESSFAYSSHSSKFEITHASPRHTDSFWFGRYSYSYCLTFERR